MKAEDIGFFDPEYHVDNSESGTSIIVTSGRYTFYRDVYIFTDRLKHLAAVRNNADSVRDLIPECLKGSALVWHSAELSELEKELLQPARLEVWISTLIKRFKTRAAVAIQYLQTQQYTMADARAEKSPRSYAQDIFRHAKAAQLTKVYNQLTIAWNNLALNFRRDIPELTSSTTISIFIDQLDSKASLWFEMAKQPQAYGARYISAIQAEKSGQYSGRGFRRSGFSRPQSSFTSRLPQPFSQGYQSRPYTSGSNSQQY